MNEPMNELIKQMRELVNDTDKESAHGSADNLLCDALKLKSSNHAQRLELVQAYEEVRHYTGSY